MEGLLSACAGKSLLAVMVVGAIAVGDRPCGRPPAQIPACAANALAWSLSSAFQISARAFFAPGCALLGSAPSTLAILCALCRCRHNVHLLRDLRPISDADPDAQLWAIEMGDTLLDAHHAAADARERGAETLDDGASPHPQPLPWRARPRTGRQPGLTNHTRGPGPHPDRQVQTVRGHDPAVCHRPGALHEQ